MNVLVTGGTGHLGRAVVARLRDEGEDVRVLARRPGSDKKIEWIQGDLATGQGIEEAVEGIDTIVHAATHSPAAQRGKLRLKDYFSSPRDVDISGTRRLLDAANRAGVGHVVHTSIVGLEHTKRLPYSRVKLEAEQVVRQAGVPWTIARATAFYWLMDRMLATMFKRPVVIAPLDVRMQNCDSDEFADFVVECVADGPRGPRKDFAGPEALTVRQIVDRYMEARGVSKRIVNAPLPQRVKQAATAGSTSDYARLGAVTWAEWLAREPAAIQEAKHEIAA